MQDTQNNFLKRKWIERIYLTLPLNNSDTNNSETAQQILKSFGGAQVAPAQSIRGLTKFYKNATHMHDDNENTWLIQLDDKPVRTPRKNIIKTPNEELAFDAQNGIIKKQKLNLLLCH